jgi:magnesium-transporting ATPase (P-type)
VPDLADLCNLCHATELILTGLVIALVTFGIFAGYLAAGPDQAAKAGTMAFSIIVISQVFGALAFSGSREKSLFKPGLFRNPWLWVALGFGVATQLLITEWAPLRAVFRDRPARTSRLAYCPPALPGPELPSWRG